MEARKEWPLDSATAISLTNAICIGFNWDSTPQGDLYWIAVGRWAKDPTNRALPEPWQPPATAPKEAQDYRDALITECHLLMGNITKSIAEMSDKLDRLQREMDFLKSGSGFVQEI